MKMKLLALTLVLLTVVVVTDDALADAIGQRRNIRLIMASGGMAGTYYPFGGALAQTINSKTDYIRTNVNASGGSAENIQLIGAGLAHYAIVQNDTMDYAYNATNTWIGPAVKKIATLMTLYPEVCQIIVAADSGINNVADMAGRYVSTGDIGSGGEANAIQILEAYGMTVKDIRQQSLGFSASAEAMRSGAIEAFFVTSGTPNTAVLDLQASYNVRILNIEQEKIDAMIAKYPFFAKYTITVGEYAFLNTDVNTVAVQATLAASPELDERIVYDIVKTIIENRDELAKAHNKGAFIAADYAVQGVSVPFHPGAAKYFKEIGVLK